MPEPGCGTKPAAEHLAGYTTSEALGLPVEQDMDLIGQAISNI